MMEKLEGNITDLNEQLQAKEKVLVEQAKVIEVNQKQIIKTDVLLKDQKMEIDKLTKELTATSQKARKMQEDNALLQDNLETVKKDVKSKRNELKVLAITEILVLVSLNASSSRFLQKKCSS